MIEDYQYHASDVRECLSGLDALENIEHMVCVNYVGYFYNPAIGDCVFILPKVLMDQSDLVFGHLKPEEIIDFDNAAGVTKEERSFIYEFAVWIYRAIIVFNRSAQSQRHRLSQAGDADGRKPQTSEPDIPRCAAFSRQVQP